MNTSKKAGRSAAKGKRAVLVLIIIGLLAATIFVYMLVINFAVIDSAKGSIVDDESAASFDADCIIVLGAGLRSDGSPSDMLTDRMKVAVELYKAGAAPRILLSGDHSREDYDEVGAMARFAIESGVPEEALILDGAGLSTYKSVKNAKTVFAVDKAVIVTQEYHLYRALYVADKLGIDAVGVSASIHSYRGQSARDLREILARNKDAVVTFFVK